jgi:hypothetical protein
MPRVRTFACRFEVLWLMQQVKEKFQKKKQKKSDSAGKTMGKRTHMIGMESCELFCFCLLDVAQQLLYLAMAVSATTLCKTPFASRGGCTPESSTALL